MLAGSVLQPPQQTFAWIQRTKNLGYYDPSADKVERTRNTALV